MESEKEMRKIWFLALEVELFLVALAKEAEQSAAKMAKSLSKFNAAMERIQEFLDFENNEDEQNWK